MNGYDVLPLLKEPERRAMITLPDKSIDLQNVRDIMEAVDNFFDRFLGETSKLQP